MLSLTKVEESIGRRMREYRNDPVGFFTGPMRLPEEYVWSKMQEMLESIRDNQFTAVKACHSVSKTFGAGRVVVWFKSTYQPSTVITTAPSDNLVRNQLWREIHAGYAAAGGEAVLGGKMTSLMWDCKPSRDVLAAIDPTEAELWEKNFAIGFSTTPDQAADQATKIQGFHNKWVLIILDEACGVLPQIWRTILESLVTNERVKVLAIGNPTDNNSYFAKVCTPGSGWNVINISVQDTPNFKEDREVIPNVAGRQYEQRIREEYGADSDTYRVRVLGQFPQFNEGAYYSEPFTSLYDQDRITPNLQHNPSIPVYTVCDPGFHWATIFFQIVGPDVHLLNCYEEIGIGAESHAEKIKQIGKEMGYRYGAHFAPVDTESNSAYKAAAGKSLLEHARENGLDLTILDPEWRVLEGIERTRQMLFRCRINSVLCEMLIMALKGYTAKKIVSISREGKSYFTDHPDDKYWGRHLSDAMRYLSLVVKKQLTHSSSVNTLTRDKIDELNAKYLLPVRV